MSFSVEPGEAIGVVGRNGQGKSTLLKLVAQVMMPDEGTVSVSGGVAPLIEITGGFVNDLSVRDNVYLTAGLHGMTRREIDQRFDEIIDFAEIARLHRHSVQAPVERHEGAHRVRRDLPARGADHPRRRGARRRRQGASARSATRRIEELLAGGRTLFFVSHNERDLLRFCTRGLYLDKGALVLDAPIKDVVNRYNADYGLATGD